jgi:osmotically inducible protein OsmC
MKIDKIIYKTKVTSTGGRDGRAVSSDGNLNVKLAVPKELGGKGESATNPEQLFAAGYSACFLSAIKHVAGKEKITISDTAAVTATVGIGEIPGGYGLAVELQVSLPGTDQNVKQSIVEKAHHVCPYSNATRGNIEIKTIII